jgi:hypothetical protein
MGIAIFFAAASNLRGELDLVVPSTRTCVHLHPGCIGHLVAILQAPETFCFGTETRMEPKIALKQRTRVPGSWCGVRRRTVWGIERNMTDSLSAGQSPCGIS